MAYGGIMFYNLHMPLYILGTFTEYPFLLFRFGTHNSGISISLQCISNPTAVGLEIDYNYSLSSS